MNNKHAGSLKDMNLTQTIAYQSPEWLEKSTLIMDCVILLVMVIVISALFIKVKFNMDFSGKLTLLLLLFAQAIRLGADYFWDIYSYAFLLSTTICTTLIWLSLYYFVFEMLLVWYLIQETYVLSFNEKKHRIWLYKWITFVVFITYVLLVGLNQIDPDEVI